MTGSAGGHTGPSCSILLQATRFLSSDSQRELEREVYCGVQVIWFWNLPREQGMECWHSKGYTYTFIWEEDPDAGTLGSLLFSLSPEGTILEGKTYLCIFFYII